MVEVRMASRDERQLEVPEEMRRYMNKTRAAHSVPAMAAMGVIKRLGLDPKTALRPHPYHDSPAKQRKRERNDRQKK
jgi:hypothetical protein